jgi:hypothetical protein
MPLFRFSFLLAAALAVNAMAAETSSDFSHSGPVLGVWVQRGETRLPIYDVPHLQKGDKLQVELENSNAQNKWAVVLASITPSGSHVTTRKFDLSEAGTKPEIALDADNEVPVIVVAQQLNTLFGLSRSFSQSSEQIADAIQDDPQRFVDLQKVDEVSHAVDTLTAGLEAAVQSAKPGHAADAAKALAGKFGVKDISSDCFKGNTVNSKCVATSIVSNKDWTLPSAGDLGTLAGPFVTAELSPDTLANLRMVAAASEFLANKYHDQYYFAPSLGKRQEGGDKLQLFTSARLKTGNVKTAYVYVPSWFSGKQPVVSLAGSATACLSQGEMKTAIDGRLPNENYWHDWTLTLREPGASAPLLKTTKLAFDPVKGAFSVDYAKLGDLAAKGQVLEATLDGQYGFEPVNIPAFKVALPVSDKLSDHLAGLDTLVSGEHARLHVTGGAGDACIETLALMADGKAVATATQDKHDYLDMDLAKVAPMEATLQLKQYGLPAQMLAAHVLKPRAHVQRLEHHDLETALNVYGDNLDRIDTIEVGKLVCHPVATKPDEPTTGLRVFSCPDEASDNTHLPAQVTVNHVDHEPSPFDVPIAKLVARPHFVIDDNAEAIRVLLSARAEQWGLRSEGKLVSDDEGMSLQLRAIGGYQLQRGNYTLQIKIADDLQTEQTPIAVPLIVNRTHNELRTRNPVLLQRSQLPGVVNPLWYRVQHQQTGFVGDWEPLNRSVVMLPAFGAVACAPDGHGLLVHGDQLDDIDWTSPDPAASKAPKGADDHIVPCDKGECLAIDQAGEGGHLRVKVHWIDDRLFDVSLGAVPACTVSTAATH